MAERIRVEITGESKDLVAACVAASGAIKGVSTTAKRADADVKASTKTFDQHTTSVNKASVAHDGLARRLVKNAQLMGALKTHVSLIKWPAMIAAVGLAAQALSNLAAGGVAVISSLSQLSGVLVAYPAVLGAVGEGLLTVKLATSGLSAALKGNQQAMKRLTPEARAFARELTAMKPKLKAVREEAQKGFFGGASQGLHAALRNFGVFRKAIGDTGKTLGGLAKDAGTLVGSKAFGRDLSEISGRNQKTLSDLGHAALELVSALRHIVIAGGPFISWLTGSARKLAEHVDIWAKTARESGRLNQFFDRTRTTLQTVASIGSNVAHALLDIGHAARPLGDSLLRSLDKASAGWARWTHSIEGQHSLKQYFDEARPGIIEMARLAASIAKAFVGLGQGTNIAPLVKQIRTELLPALVQVINSTTTAFGPALVHALTQVVRLLASLAGSSGPLTIYVKVLGDLAEILDSLIRSSPFVQSTMVTLLGFAGVVKALKFATAITGVKALTGAFIGLRAAAVGATAAETTAAAAGAAGGIPIFGPKGQVLKTVERGGGGAAAGAEGGLMAGGAAGLAKNVLTKIGSGSALGGLARVSIWGDIGLGMAKGVITGFHKGISTGAQEALHSITLGLTPGPKDFSAQDKRITDDIDRINELANQAAKARKAGIHLDVDFKHDKFDQGVDDVLNQIARTRKGMANSLAGARSDAEMNLTLIAHSMNIHSTQGKQAVAANFRAVASEIKNAMDASGHTTKAGTEAIHGYLLRALAALGIKGNANREGYLALQDFRSNNKGTGTGAGGAARGKLVQYGRAGDAGGDNIPARVGGQDLVVGSGEVGMVMNRHQQAVANARLADVGGLSGLFQNVRTPHYMAGGGFVPGPGTNFSVGSEPEIVRRLSRLAASLHTTIFGISGWRSPQRSVAVGGFPNDPHTRGAAADIGVGSMSRASAGRLSEALLERFGLTRPFGGASEINHIQLLGGGGGGGALAAAVKPIPRATVKGTNSPLKSLVQGGLDRVRSAAQKRLSASANAAGAGGSGDGAAGAGGVTGSVASIVAQISKQRGWSASDWNWIISHESGGRAVFNKTGSGAFGVGQLMPSNYSRLGGAPGSSLAEQTDAMGRYIAERYGNPTAARRYWEAHGNYARGGIVKGVLRAATGLGPTPAPAGRGGPRPRMPMSTTLAHIPTVWRSLVSHSKKPHKSKTLPPAKTISGYGVELIRRAVEEGIPTLQERYSIAEDIANRTDETFIVQPNDGSAPFVDWQAVAQRRGELAGLGGIESNVKTSIEAAAALVQPTLDKIAQAIAERVKQLEAIKQEFLDNLARLHDVRKKIKDRQKALAAEQKKKKPDHGTIGSLKGQLAVLHDEESKLVGRNNTLGGSERSLTGGLYSGVSAIKGGLIENRTSVEGWRTDLVGLTGGGGWWHDADETLANLAKQAGEIGDGALASQLKQLTGGGSSDLGNLLSLLAELTGVRNEITALNTAQNPIFSQFLGEIAGGLPYLGGFAHGTQRVPQTGFALLHRDEQVITDPEGPYGSQIARGGSARAGDINLHLHGDIGRIIQQALVEHEGRVVQLVDRHLGRRSRQISYAPG